MPKPLYRTRRPTTDWYPREVLDSRAVAPDEITKCEFCNTQIRWIHVLGHDDYHHCVEAGCCCAQRLCFEYDAAAAENEIRNRLGRLMRFVDSRRWKQSKSNPENTWRWLKIDGKRERITVFLKDGTYGVYFSLAQHWGRYDTLAKAKAIAFDLIERAKEDRVKG